MLNYTIDDPLDAHGGIEVTIEFPGGEKRWCFFITPESLRAVGDHVPGSEVRYHIGERHMIVIAELSAELVDAVLKDLDRRQLLERHTLRLE